MFTTCRVLSVSCFGSSPALDGMTALFMMMCAIHFAAINRLMGILALNYHLQDGTMRESGRVYL